jgi:hypothetical protein
MESPIQTPSTVTPTSDDMGVAYKVPLEDEFHFEAWTNIPNGRSLSYGM